MSNNNLSSSAKPLFSWMHLSDIHFQTKTEKCNDKLIRKNLPKFLKELHPSCDAIIITGDYRYGRKKEETSATNVYDYIKSISSAINVKDEKIVLVPGNHDLDRSKSRSYHIMGIKNEYDPDDGKIDSDVLASLTKDFAFYTEIHKNYPKSLELGRENPHDIIDLDSCYLLLLNTALIAGTEKEDEHNLIVGTGYLIDLLDEDNRPLKPIIAIGHHSLDMLRQDDKDEVTNLLDGNGVRLYLCGHVHKNWRNSFGEDGKQITVGCMSLGQGKNSTLKAGFSIGTLFDNGDVQIDMYMWDRSTKSWNYDRKNSKTYFGLYHDFINNIPTVPSNHQIDVKEEQNTPTIPSKNQIDVKKEQNIPTVPSKNQIDVKGEQNTPAASSENQFNLNDEQNLDFVVKGHLLLGDHGKDGIKYYWKKNSDILNGLYVESIVANKSLTDYPEREREEHLSFYTASVSKGCLLSTFKSQCVFCETGLNKNQYYPLTADEIALQCIFMAEWDSTDCRKVVRNNKREFAFIGQGEPGFCYSMVKRAILLTDEAMKKINQKVSKYVIYTSGVTDFIPDLINDYKTKVFSRRRRVSVFFSLNTIDGRDSLMPINKLYPCKEFIKQCKSLHKITNEKIEVGVLLMSNYTTKSNPDSIISLDANRFEAILKELDNEVFRIVLCYVNETNLGSQRELSRGDEEVNKLIKLAEENDFECRLLSSIGGDRESACGQLKSSPNRFDQLAGARTEHHYKRALKLLLDAKKELDRLAIKSTNRRKRIRKTMKYKDT